MMNKLKHFFIDHTVLILVLASSTVSIISFVYYYLNNQLILYADSSTHLNMSRSIVDSLTPGIGQIGGMWLPLFHVLMLPTIWNDFMWHSGVSAYVVNFIAFTFSAYFIFKLLHILTEKKIISFFGALILISNPNLIYIHVTAMNEMLFIATLLGSAYYLAKWSKDEKISSLMLTGIMVLLTTINRYEGWFVFAYSFLAVIVISVYKYKKIKKTEGLIIIFASLASAGIFFWLIWQLVIFNDTFYFLHSEFSSKAQTLSDIYQGKVPSYHNIKTAILTYSLATLNDNGFILTTVSFFGFLTIIITSIYTKNKKQLIDLIIVCLLASPFIFECYAQYNGNIPLQVPQLAPFGTFNLRFGIYMFPAVVVFSMWLIAKYKHIKILLIPLILIQLVFFYSYQPVLVTAAQDEFFDYKIHSANWLQDNYNGGYILASDKVFNYVILNSNIGMKYFITERNQKYWDESIKNPAKYATWAIVSNNNSQDMLYKKVGMETLLNNFEIKNKNKDYIIMKKIAQD